MKLGKLFVDLALNAGITIDDEKLKEITTSDLEVPDEIGNQFKANLMSVDAAKNNAELKNHFYKLALNPMDKFQLERAKGIQGFTDEDVRKLEELTSSYEKAKFVDKRLAEILEAKSGSGDGDETERLKKLKKEIEDLNLKLSSKDTDHQKALDDFAAKAEKDVIEFALMSELLSKDFADDKRDKLKNAKLTRVLLDDEFATQKVALKKSEDGSLKLVQKENPDLDYMVDNKPVTLSAFVDTFMGREGLLKVANPDNPGGSGGSGGGKPRIDPDGKEPSLNPDSVRAAYDAQIASMAASEG